MFRKNKENSIKNTVICDADKSIIECESIFNIREYQRQLGRLDDLHLENIIVKYFPFEIDSDFLRAFFIYIMKSNEHQIGSFEEYYSRLGKDIDECLQLKAKQLELNFKIQEEKNKLGIK